MNELDAFRNEIKNYNYYKKKIKKLQEQIDDKYYDLFGVKGVDFSRQVLENKNPLALDYRMLDSIEKFDKFQKEINIEINRLKSQIDFINNKLSKMDDLTRKIFIYVYIKNYSYNKTCKLLNISLGNLQYLMKKAFKEQ